MCRCPDERPFWFETEDSDDEPKGECVSDCDAAAAALLSDTSSKLTWLIILIIVLAAIILIIIIYCFCRLLVHRGQKAKEREVALTSPPIYSNKASRQSPTLNNIYEADDDAIYADEGDIQYSEGNDQRYDYDHYLAPDGTLPPSVPAPELPDAPIPSEPPLYVNKPTDVRETANNDTPDILNNLAVNFKDKDSVYENN